MAETTPTNHHIEFSWQVSGTMRAHCTACDEYVESHPLPNGWHTARRTQQQLRALLDEAPCHPDRRGPVIVFAE